MPKDEIICTECWYKVRRSSLSEHINKFECQLNKVTNEAEKEDLEMVSVSARIGNGVLTETDHKQIKVIYAALKHAGINHRVFEHSVDKSQSYMAIWAPAWLAQALKNYNHKQGYADLSLSQYLDMVKP